VFHFAGHRPLSAGPSNSLLHLFVGYSQDFPESVRKRSIFIGARLFYLWRGIKRALRSRLGSFCHGVVVVYHGYDGKVQVCPLADKSEYENRAIPRKEYLMLEKIRITNFRCFKKLELGPFKRFNVLVGPSGSGKTAFLEAIFLAGGGSAEIYLRIRKWRGLTGPISIGNTKAAYESLFREIFYGFNPEPGAFVELDDSRLGTRKLSIGFKGELEFRLSIKEPVGNAFVIEPIIFQWKAYGRKAAESTVEVKDGQLAVSGTTDVYPIWLISPAAPESLVHIYSELSKRGKANLLIEEFCRTFPKVRGLTIESAAGEFAIFADLLHHEEKLPIGTLSAGMSKYLSILIAIAANPKGVVLIDEIESGFYFESLPLLLKSICDFAESNDVQLIATTHSYELLESFALAMEGREEHFDLLRSVPNDDDGTVEIKISRGPAAISAIRQRIEIR
jgi:ABC-type lipoprotein export system ATPase subunit